MGFIPVDWLEVLEKSIRIMGLRCPLFMELLENESSERQPSSDDSVEASALRSWSFFWIGSFWTGKMLDLFEFLRPLQWPPMLNEKEWWKILISLVSDTTYWRLNWKISTSTPEFMLIKMKNKISCILAHWTHCNTVEQYDQNRNYHTLQIYVGHSIINI